MTVIDIKRRRELGLLKLPPEREIVRALLRTLDELGGEEGMRGYFKTLAKEHPDQFVKLLLAVLHGR